MTDHTITQLGLTWRQYPHGDWCADGDGMLSVMPTKRGILMRGEWSVNGEPVLLRAKDLPRAILTASRFMRMTARDAYDDLAAPELPPPPPPKITPVPPHPVVDLCSQIGNGYARGMSGLDAPVLDALLSLSEHWHDIRSRYVQKDWREHLSDLLTLYCEREHLTPASADEMLVDSSLELTHSQRAFLSCYLRFWEECEQEERCRRFGEIPAPYRVAMAGVMADLFSNGTLPGADFADAHDGLLTRLSN